MLAQFAKVAGCTSGQAAWSGPKKLGGCIVVGINGETVNHGNIAELVARMNAAGSAPISLMLEACEDATVTLNP